MVEIEDGLAYISQNITYIVTIIGAFFVGTKFVISEIHKRTDRLDKKIMGPEGHAQVGKGGAIDDLRTELRTEYLREIKAAEERLEVKMNKANERLLFEIRQSMQKLNFVVSNLSRMERSLEKVTDGKYTSARMETNREDGYNEMDNPDPDDSEAGFNADNYNKRRRRD